MLYCRAFGIVTGWPAGSDSRVVAARACANAERSPMPMTDAIAMKSRSVKIPKRDEGLAMKIMRPFYPIAPPFATAPFHFTGSVAGG
jgi:hypothetical protein